MKRENVYPFTAIVGQEEMKTALLLSIVSPHLGGVLIQGEKGTAKSTAVRALAALLPPRRCIEGCRFHCDPDHRGSWCGECRERFGSREAPAVQVPMEVVELPVNATEDRVVGTLDIESAIREGRKRFEPGLLAEANRNILYADEINLLDDHVVDVLLDAAAMGVNTVEREGISYSHPARFALVGTMNPEEGDLRPQLLDRFALSVSVAGEKDPEKRAEVIRRRLSYERDPEGFLQAWKPREEEEARRITEAQARLDHVDVSDECIMKAARISIALGVDGHRSDITLVKAAAAYAALEGRLSAGTEDLRQAARLVLPHRMRKQPFEKQSVSWDRVEQVLSHEA